jgi:hypothetical protein
MAHRRWLRMVSSGIVSVQSSLCLLYKVRVSKFAEGAVADIAVVYERLGIGWATSLLGFLSILMLPIPWVFFKYGPAVRKRSRYPVMM